MRNFLIILSCFKSFNSYSINYENLRKPVIHTKFGSRELTRSECSRKGLNYGTAYVKRGSQIISLEKTIPRHELAKIHADYNQKRNKKFTFKTSYHHSNSNSYCKPDLNFEKSKFHLDRVRRQKARVEAHRLSKTCCSGRKGSQCNIL